MFIVYRNSNGNVFGCPITEFDVCEKKATIKLASWSYLECVLVKGEKPKVYYNNDYNEIYSEVTILEVSSIYLSKLLLNSYVEV